MAALKAPDTSHEAVASHDDRNDRENQRDTGQPIPFKCGTCGATYRSYQLCAAHVVDTHKFSPIIRHQGIKSSDGQCAVYKDKGSGKMITSVTSTLPETAVTGISSAEVRNSETVVSSSEKISERLVPLDSSGVVMFSTCSTSFTSEMACLNHKGEEHELTKGLHNLQDIGNEVVTGTTSNNTNYDSDQETNSGNRGTCMEVSAVADCLKHTGESHSSSNNSTLMQSGEHARNKEGETGEPGTKLCLFMCPVCHADFPTHAACCNHAVSLHGITLKSPPNNLQASSLVPEESRMPDVDGSPTRSQSQKKTFVCFSCRLRFSTLDALNRHIKSDHVNDSLLASPPTRFGVKRELKPRENKNGKRSRKKGKRVSASGPSCSLCGKTTSSVKSCRKHILRAHGNVQQQIPEGPGPKRMTRLSSEMTCKKGDLDGMLELSEDILQGWNSPLPDKGDTGDTEEGANVDAEDRVSGARDGGKGAKLRVLTRQQVDELVEGPLLYRCSICSMEFKRCASCIRHMKRQHSGDWSESSRQRKLHMTMDSQGDEGTWTGPKHLMIVYEDGQPSASNSAAKKRERTQAKWNDRQKSFKKRIFPSGVSDSTSTSKDYLQELTGLNRLISKSCKSQKQMERLHNCVYCGKTYSTAGNYNKHLREKHSVGLEMSPKKKYEFVCDVCGLIFSWKGTYVAHLKTHSTTREDTVRISCPNCRKSFKSKDRFDNHNCSGKGSRRSQQDQSSSSKTVRNDLECRACGAKFARQVTLDAHIAKVKEASYACQMCCKIFPEAPRLERHTFFHHDRKTHSCDQCRRRFSSSRTLHLHKVFAHKEKSIQAPGYQKCGVCGCLFISESLLEAHKCRGRHVGTASTAGPSRIEAPSPCNKCGSSFPNRIALASHECPARIVKTIPSVFVHDVSVSCNLCGEKFSDADQLAFHECRARQAASAPRKLELPRGKIGGDKPVALSEEDSKSVMESYASRFGRDPMFPHCERCNEWFPSESQKAEHSCSVRKKGRKTVSKEGRKPSPKKAKATPRREQKQVRIQCTTCEYEFRDAVQMASHRCANAGSLLATVTNPKRSQMHKRAFFQCKKCNYKFPDEAQLATHTCIYPNEEQYLALQKLFTL